MAKSIALGLFAARSHLGHDIGDAGAFRQKDADAIFFIHGFFQAPGFGFNVNGQLWHVNGVNVFVLHT